MKTLFSSLVVLLAFGMSAVAMPPSPTSSVQDFCNNPEASCYDNAGNYVGEVKGPAEGLDDQCERWVTSSTRWTTADGTHHRVVNHDGTTSTGTGDGTN